jgi:hypothetical protein
MTGAMTGATTLVSKQRNKGVRVIIDRKKGVRVTIDSRANKGVRVIIDRALPAAAGCLIFEAVAAAGFVRMRR